MRVTIGASRSVGIFDSRMLGHDSSSSRENNVYTYVGAVEVLHYYYYYVMFFLSSSELVLKQL